MRARISTALGVARAANRISQRRSQPPTPEDGSAGPERISEIPGALALAGIGLPDGKTPDGRARGPEPGDLGPAFRAMKKMLLQTLGLAHGEIPLEVAQKPSLRPGPAAAHVRPSRRSLSPEERRNGRRCSSSSARARLSREATVPGSAAEDAADLDIGKPFEIAEDDDVAHLGGEPRQGDPQDRPAQVRIRRAGPAVDLIPAAEDGLERHGRDAAPPVVAPAFVAGDPVDPRLQARAEAEAAQAAEGLEKDRLKDVLRLADVADGIDDEGPDAVAVGAVELPEGGLVAGPDGQGQPAVAVDLRRGEARPLRRHANRRRFQARFLPREL